MTMNQRPEKLPRDLCDPNEMPQEPRGIEQTTLQTGHQAETGAPKGRGPDGKLITPSDQK
ncbi:MAG: hypothetical protein ABI321_20500 [Polyangia bacterium]